jgi:hypothetical protein
VSENKGKSNEGNLSMKVINNIASIRRFDGKEEHLLINRIIAQKSTA